MLLLLPPSVFHNTEKGAMSISQPPSQCCENRIPASVRWKPQSHLIGKPYLLEPRPSCQIL